MKYMVDYVFDEPVYGGMKIDADTKEEAATLVLEELEATYPEVDIFEILRVEEVND